MTSGQPSPTRQTSPTCAASCTGCTPSCGCTPRKRTRTTSRSPTSPACRSRLHRAAASTLPVSDESQLRSRGFLDEVRSAARAGLAGLVALLVEDRGRIRGGLGSPLHAKFGEERGDVVLHRLLSQEQPLADLPVRQALPDQLENLPLLTCQCGQRIGAAGSLPPPGPPPACRPRVAPIPAPPHLPRPPPPLTA